jgi:hypothetical protein
MNAGLAEVADEDILTAFQRLLHQFEDSLDEFGKRQHPTETMVYARPNLCISWFDSLAEEQRRSCFSMFR